MNKKRRKPHLRIIASLCIEAILALSSCSPSKDRDVSKKTQYPTRSSIAHKWLAAVADFTEPVYSVSQEEARIRGLFPLESIHLPNRALAVDGKWPGEAGYPFSVDSATEEIGQGGYPFTIAAVGDIAIADEDAIFFGQEEPGLSRFLGTAYPILSRPDILVGNLEGVISGRGEPNPRKRFHFRFPSEAPRELVAAGFDLMLFANNHGFDYGREAFLDTLTALDRINLPYVGAGIDLASASEGHSFVLPDIQGARIVFVGFASFPQERLGFTTKEATADFSVPGIASEESATIDAIRVASTNGCFVVVLAHGGEEYSFAPSPEVRKRYRRFIEAGARIVFGSHPHVLQGVEVYKNSLIVYSLGNFLFTADEEPAEAVAGAMIEILITGREIRGMRLDPVLALRKGTILDVDRSHAEMLFAKRCKLLNSEQP